MKFLATCLFALVLLQTAFAQDVNFGQNKVQYENFDWRYISSEHFDVYFTKGAEGIAEFTAETAERSLKEIEHSFNYHLEGRVTIVTYRSHNNFEQTNVSSEAPEESVGGFTEFLKNRVVLPFTGNYEDFRHVIHHELTHAVNMRMFYGTGFQSILLGVTTSNIPLWFIEGLAEYESRHGWDVEADMFMRDATISGYLPPMDELYGYLAYKGGQSVFYYVDRKYGSEKVSELLNKVKTSRDVERAVKSVLGLEMKDFNRDWQNWLRRIYWPTVADLHEPTDFAERLTDHVEWGDFVNNGGGISPDGSQVVFLSDRTDYFDIWSLNIDSGKFKRLLRGERSEGFEQLKWLDARISWSPDGKNVVFASKAGSQDAVNILNVKKRKVTNRLRFDLDGIFNPTWSPDGQHIAFVGLKDGQSDLYYYDLKLKSLTKVTDDIFSDDDPAWAPDSKSLVFTSDRGDSLRVRGYGTAQPMWSLNYHSTDLYTIALGDSIAQRLTNTPTHERTATFTPDGQYLIYAADANGIFNLYRRNVATGQTDAITNCLTGCSQPSYSLRTQRLVFTSLYRGGYDVYLIKNPQELPAVTLSPTNFRSHGTPEPDKIPQIDTTRYVTKTDPVAADVKDPGRPYARFVFGDTQGTTPADVKDHAMADTNTTRKESGGFFSKKYKTRFTPDYVFATAAYSSFFGAQGSGQILFSDVLGNQVIFATTDLYYDFNNLDNTNFSVQYFYLPHRINYGVGLFRYVYYLNNGDWRDQTWQGVINASYPFSKYSRAELNLNGYFITRASWRDDVENYSFLAKRRVALPELSYTHDTVLWGITGPVNGTRYRLSYAFSPALGQNPKDDPNGRVYDEFYTMQVDFRDYFRLHRDFSWASRLVLGYSGGRNPQKFFLGGVSNWINRRYQNNEIPSDINDFYFSSFVTPFRGGDYFEKRGTGDHVFLTNQEFRFPLIQQLQMRFPLPIGLYNVRGAMFTDIGAAWSDNNFKLTAEADNDGNLTTDGTGKRRLWSPRVAYGLGVRSNLGIFVLRWDVAWGTDGVSSTRARYFFSIGAEY
jgi:Tol biopolymer transport system component